MKLVALVFVFFGYTIFKFLVLQGTSPALLPEVPALQLPTLDLLEVNFDFTENPCATWVWFTGVGTIFCATVAIGQNLDDTAHAIGNIVICIVWAIMSIYEFVKFVALMIGFVAQLIFKGVEGAPLWLNLLVFTPFGLIAAIGTYRLIRKGDSSG